MPGYTPEQLRNWYPRVRPPPPPKRFEIGIVLAGAVSAGAYTAGVLDFLFEALDAWHRAKLSDDPAVPRHEVVLRVVTGASAGGINGAIAAAALRYAFPPKRPAAKGGDGEDNPFYRAWVEQIDIRHLLATDDLEEGELRSLLNCDILLRIARDTVGYKGPPLADRRMRSWIANPLPVVLTVTNLRGVPYALNFQGSRLRHEMTLHQDYVGFAVPELSPLAAEEPLPDLVRLPPDNDFDDPDWHRLAIAALATGAFPIALQPRVLGRIGGDYGFRMPYFDADGEEPSFYAPAWPGNAAPDPYSFLCVDGGVTNNEPFELARIALAGIAGHNPRAGAEAHRAAIMIDPFADPQALGPGEEAPLTAVAGAIVTALKDQARFKPTDLALAQASDVYSRYMVAPSRGAEQGSRALASGELGAFFGFFSEDFRRHDFLLGRRNCQRFLQTAFTLPKANPLFAGTWPDEADARYADALDPTHRQIIPLVGDCAVEEPLPEWPRGFRRTEELDRLIAARADAVYGHFRRRLFGGEPPPDEGFLGRIKRGTGAAAGKTYLDLGWKLYGRGKLLESVKRSIDAAAEAIRTA